MKNFTFLIFIFIAQHAHSQGIGIGSTNPPHPSAELDVNSSTKGFLVPRMTTAQRNAITSPSVGLQVFDTTTNSFWYYNGTAWTNVYVGNFSLPFNSTGNSTNFLFSITNTGNIVAGSGSIYGESNFGPGISGKSTLFTGIRGESSGSSGISGISSTGSGVYGLSSSGSGGNFQNNSNNSPTLVASNAGTGAAARFNGKVEMTDNLEVDGTLTVKNGKGIVRSNSATQQKIVRTTFSVGVGFTLGAFSTIISGEVSLETFSGIPTVYVGNVDSQTGEYYKVIITPVAATTNSVRFRLYNASDTSSTFSGVWNIVAIGPE
jgi:hypothetical protein